METTEGVGRRLGSPPAGGCDGGGAFAGGVDLLLFPPEHSGAIYCYYYYYVPVSSSKAEARAKGGNAVVGTVGSIFGGDADGGPVGGADGGVGGYVQDRDCYKRLFIWGGYCSKHNLRYRA